jgi:16S rRNA (guanine527-N7)-methyltransferase
MDSKQLQKMLEEALGRSISEEQSGLLHKHLAFIIEQNESLNLTSIQGFEEGAVLHIEDSLTALPEIEEAPEGVLLDLGSGAGFPGIPLAVVTTRPCVLVESRKKKARVLQRFISENGLGGKVTVEALRIEELAQRLPDHFAVATARALSSLPSLMELAAPLLQEDGLLIAYKGRLTEEETTSARALEETLGMSLQTIRSLTLSDNSSPRTIVQLKKTAPAKIPLPRPSGKAQTHPLKH